MADIPPDLTATLERPLFESISLIDADDLTDTERARVPPWWLDAAGRSGRDGIELALTQWDATLPGLLPKFKQRLRTDGMATLLGRSTSAGKPLLAYVLAAEPGPPLCWYGFPRNAQLHHPSLDLGKLPTTVRPLYTELHDGFKQAAMFHNGFPASDSLSAVSRYGEADDFEFFNTDIQPDLDKLIPIFFDYGGAAVCVELSDNPDSRVGWHWSEASLEPYADIWEMLDNWMLSLRR
jgi:hypothetical protein